MANNSNPIKLVHVIIEGMAGSSLLMHRYSEEAQATAAKTTRTTKLKRKLPREEATEAAYINEDGTLYFPGAAISALLREAGTGHKQTGSRKSLKWIVPAAAIMQETRMALYAPDTGNMRKREPLREFEVDSQRVVIRTTQGTILRHRARLDAWQAEFSIEIDTEVLDTDSIQMLLQEGGRRIGIGDFRPAKGGSYGRFMIKEWVELE